MINKFSAIIGNCDLITETADLPQQAERVSQIREIAHTAIKELAEHQLQAERESRRAETSKAS